MLNQSVRKEGLMYIPEFWVGFVVGIAVSIGLLIIAAFWFDRKKK